mgnify:CR=1 FL=1
MAGHFCRFSPDWNRSMPRHTRSTVSFRPVCIGIGVVLTGVLLGCDERLEQPATSQANAPQSQTVLEGGGSASGKAINSAQSIRQQTEIHNEKIEKAAEEVGKD